jgi:hypothetical protein
MVWNASRCIIKASQDNRARSVLVSAILLQAVRRRRGGDSRDVPAVWRSNDDGFVRIPYRGPCVDRLARNTICGTLDLRELQSRGQGATNCRSKMRSDAYHGNKEDVTTNTTTVRTTHLQQIRRCDVGRLEIASLPFLEF